MPRYVILRHEMPADSRVGSHWDLMLEEGPALRTWRFFEIMVPGCSLEIEPLGDHRLSYLDYEGPVSGDRGHVLRWDSGSYHAIAITPDRWQIALSGSRLQGKLSLTRETEACWRLNYWGTASEVDQPVDRD